MKKDNDTSFLARVILFFRALRDKIASLKIFSKISMRQRTLSHYNGKKAPEEAKIAYILGISKIISASALCILLLLTVVFGSGAISYEKVYYMVKDISYVKSFGEGAPESLSYSRPVQNQVFEVYKNGLVAASDSEIKMFTATGRVTLTAGSEMVNPRVSTSSGYILIYDQGRKSFSVYNSFVKLYSEHTEYPVAFADMSDNGEFLVVASSAKYASVVKIYNGEFKLQSELSKNERVIWASISSNGRYAAVMTLGASAGEAKVKVSVLDCKKGEVISETDVSGSMPYRCDFLSNDRIAILLDDKALVISREGRAVGEYVYPASAQRIDVYKDRFAILFSEGAISGQKQLSVFDSGCSNIFTASVEGSIRDLELSGSYVYLLNSKEAIRISTTLGTRSVKDVYADTVALVAFDDGRVAACSAASGVYISFD